jgi:hypothetical protein
MEGEVCFRKPWRSAPSFGRSIRSQAIPKILSQSEAADDQFTAVPANPNLAYRPTGSLCRNPRRNDSAVDRMCASIREFGFKIPVLARSDGTVVDGHLRLKAARKLGITEIPVILCDECCTTSR